MKGSRLELSLEIGLDLRLEIGFEIRRLDLRLYERLNLILY